MVLSLERVLKLRLRWLIGSCVPLVGFSICRGRGLTPVPIHCSETDAPRGYYKRKNYLSIFYPDPTLVKHYNAVATPVGATHMPSWYSRKRTLKRKKTQTRTTHREAP
jgi:hypothetical protein